MLTDFLKERLRTAMKDWRESDQNNPGRDSVGWSLGMRPHRRPNANTAECLLLQCFTIPTALRISGSGISRSVFPIHGVLRASVVSLQLVEQWFGFLGAASWRDSPY